MDILTDKRPTMVTSPVASGGADIEEPGMCALQLALSYMSFLSVGLSRKRSEPQFRESVKAQLIATYDRSQLHQSNMKQLAHLARPSTEPHSPGAKDWDEDDDSVIEEDVGKLVHATGAASPSGGRGPTVVTKVYHHLKCFMQPHICFSSCILATRRTTLSKRGGSCVVHLYTSCENPVLCGSESPLVLRWLY